MRVRFIADANISQFIIDGLRHREPSIDILDATEAGVRGLSDPEVLMLAAASGRVLISHDRNTMIGYFWKFVEAHESPGLVIVKQRQPIRQAVAQIHSLWVANDVDGWRNQLMFGVQEEE